MSMKDRPERPERPGRTRPVPAPDAGVDPVDFRPTSAVTLPASPPDAPPAAPPAKGGSAPAAGKPSPDAFGARATVQAGVNWSIETEAIVREVKARTGKTRRAIVEEAIARTWGAAT